MGTDIHMRVEVRVDGKWQEANANPYRNRNYDVFAVLAGVRNGSGFAGCDTGDPVTPISEPRGLPEDDSAKPYKDPPFGWSSEADDPYYYSCLGDHSFSWLTLEEILAYDWHQAKVKRGVISLAAFAKWDAAGCGMPEGGWSGGISGPNVFHVSNDTARGLLRDDYEGQVQKTMATAREYKWGRCDKRELFAEFYTQVQWETTIAERCREFVEEYIPALQTLGAPQDVRIVFGFDS